MIEKEDDLKVSAMVSPNFDSVSVGIFSGFKRVYDGGGL